MYCHTISAFSCIDWYKAKKDSRQLGPAWGFSICRDKQLFSCLQPSRFCLPFIYPFLTLNSFPIFSQVPFHLLHRSILIPFPFPLQISFTWDQLLGSTPFRRCRRRQRRLWMQGSSRTDTDICIQGHNYYDVMFRPIIELNYTIVMQIPTSHALNFIQRRNG